MCYQQKNKKLPPVHVWKLSRRARLAVLALFIFSVLALILGRDYLPLAGGFIISLAIVGGLLGFVSLLVSIPTIISRRKGREAR